MKKLLIATRNQGKVGEFKEFLKDLPFEIVSLQDLGIKEDIEENGKTYRENSQKKALFFARLAKLPTIADDGGIEIDALEGKPGINSKHWAKDEDEIIKKLTKLSKNLPKKNRKATFRTVISFALPNGKAWSSTSKTQGIIAEKKSGKKDIGYPYRLFFYLPKIKKYYYIYYISIG